MLIKGKTITLYERTASSTNAFGENVYVETVTQVNNVLIQPTSSEAIANELEMYGRHSSYVLHIPKEDTHNWKDCIVVLGNEFDERRYKQFGDIPVYHNELLPLAWSKQVKVELYE